MEARRRARALARKDEAVQTAYTRLELVESAVIDCLSLKIVGFVSRLITFGSPQVAPPLVDLLTRSAWSKSNSVSGGKTSLKERDR